MKATVNLTIEEVKLILSKEMEAKGLKVESISLNVGLVGECAGASIGVTLKEEI